jgi:hypothetical protein
VHELQHGSASYSTTEDSVNALQVRSCLEDSEYSTETE